MDSNFQKKPMSERHQQIGFNRYIKLEWLDFAAGQMLAGRPLAQIKTSLNDLLKDQLSVGSDAVRGSRGKTVSMLLSIWVTVPRPLVPLRDAALEQMRFLPSAEHLPFHWGMTMAAYPFFGVVAESAGRSLNLQGNVSVNLLKSRMRDLYGQRETVLRSTRYVLQCLSGWGLLNETSRSSGIYTLPATHSIQNSATAAWLFTAALASSDTKMAPLKALVQSPRLFPFKIETDLHAIREGDQLEYFRQGLDEEMVMLKGVR